MPPREQGKYAECVGLDGDQLALGLATVELGHDDPAAERALLGVVERRPTGAAQRYAAPVYRH